MNGTSGVYPVHTISLGWWTLNIVSEGTGKPSNLLQCSMAFRWSMVRWSMVGLLAILRASNAANYSHSNLSHGIREAKGYGQGACSDHGKYATMDFPACIP